MINALATNAIGQDGFREPLGRADFFSNSD